jgi:hypothetical protein
MFLQINLLLAAFGVDLAVVGVFESSTMNKKSPSFEELLPVLYTSREFISVCFAITRLHFFLSASDIAVFVYSNILP